MAVPSSVRVFKLKDFEGPLDLLLFLIKKNDVNIYNIPVGEITEQYLSYLRAADEISLEDMSEFHALAANLLYIKSRTLLPLRVDLENSGEDPRLELVETLIEYQKFKKLADMMEAKAKSAELTMERKKVQHESPLPSRELWEKIDIGELLHTFSKLMTTIDTEQVIDLYEEVSVNEKIALLTELLDSRGECFFEDLLVRKGSVMEIVCAFLAILEAVKVKLVTIEQNTVFGNIVLKPFRKNFSAN